MVINATEVEQVQTSFQQLLADLDTHSAVFYASLFRHAPELRPMFRDDLEGQGMKFMTTLGAIVRNLDDQKEMESQFSELGQQHASLGVVAGNFEPMGKALIDTLRSALGDGFTPELEQAWRNVYLEFTNTMIRLGNIPDR